MFQTLNWFCLADLIRYSTWKNSFKWNYVEEKSYRKSVNGIEEEINIKMAIWREKMLQNFGYSGHDLKNI